MKSTARTGIRPVFLNTLRAEYAKLVSLRAPRIITISAILTVVTLSGVLTNAVSNALQEGRVKDVAALEPATAFLVLLHYGQLSAIVMGTWLVVEEQEPGAWRTTLLATPTRSIVFWAKALIALVSGTCLAVPTILGSYYIRRLTLDTCSIGSEGVSDFTILAGYICYWTLLCVLAYFLAITIRNGIVAMAGFVAHVVIVSPFLMSKTKLARFLPDQAGAQMYLDAPAIADDLGRLGGYSVLIAWVIGFAILGNCVFYTQAIRD